MKDSEDGGVCCDGEAWEEKGGEEGDEDAGEVAEIVHFARGLSKFEVEFEKRGLCCWEEND